MSGGNIKVVVRCRPLNSRELARGATCLIRMEGNQTILTSPSDEKNFKAFTFDKSYWSGDRSAPNYASQDTIYNDLGVELLDHAFEGYNTCIFAYGQTGSGKSYSMMGYGEDKGLIPRTCNALFQRILSNEDPNLSFRVEVSYIEIYNERVRDLLNPKVKGPLRVREHPSLGPYVEDLSKLVVTSFSDIDSLMDEGNKARTVAATNMNETSSRSHAVFTVLLTQKRFDELTKLETEKVSRISLVDLAGSERANATGATGQRLKEGANINKSLTTLGKVIAALAENSSGHGKKKKEVFIPYRDSVLTWLLKDSLGGNSKTAMIAAISPADYEETLSTLRYADQAKKIKNKAVVNEDPNAKLIRDLKEELELLRSKLAQYDPDEAAALAANSVASPGGGRTSTLKFNPKALVTITDIHGNVKTMSKEEIQDQLQASEKLLKDINETWEDKLRKTQEIQAERERTLEELGIMVERNHVGVHTPKKVPHLVNLNEDPLMSECLIYQIKPGITRVGRMDSDVPAEIRLSGDNILSQHCHFENNNGVVTLHPAENSMTMVNGQRISKSRRIRSGFRVILGDHHVFRFNNPEEVRRERESLQRSAVTQSANLASGGSISNELPVEPDIRPDSPTSSASVVSEAMIDWNYARREAYSSITSSEHTFDNLNNEELEKLHNDIAKAFKQRRSGQPESREGDSSTESSVSLHDRLNPEDEITGEELIRRAELEQKLKNKEEQIQKLQRSYESELKRMSKQVLASGLLPGFSEEELLVARRVADHWRGLRYIKLAEDALKNAVLLKEANIISRELEKQVLYQFTILDDTSAAVSFWENTAAFGQLSETEDVSLASTQKPAIAVKVLDMKHEVIYVWPLEKLQSKLQQMRRLYNYIDRPSVSKHFNWEDPFYEKPSPLYTLIGIASVPLQTLLAQKRIVTSVPILNGVTGVQKGYCRIELAPIVAANHHQQHQAHDTKETEIGGQLLFEVVIGELHGISEVDFTELHVQFRLSSFGNVSPYSSAERIFATLPASGFGESFVDFAYRQSLTLALTPEVLEKLRIGVLPFEIFGRARPRALLENQRYDDIREQASLRVLPSPHVNEMNGNGDDASSSSEMRRKEDDWLSEERHDVMAWIQVAEPGATGDYVPVNLVAQGNNPLDQGAFQLRQGYQRRILLTLSHNSGQQFRWTRVSKLAIGCVRLLDSKGRLAKSPSHGELLLNLLPNQEVEYHLDGTSTLTAQGAWDSSLHESPFLNRPTPQNQRVVLSMKCYVETERCLEPILFSTDIAIQVNSREARTPSRLAKLLGSTRQLSRMSALFLVTLRPSMARNPADLWRLNTAGKYVRGEEVLGQWRPRGVSLVTDYRRARALIHRVRDVELTRQRLICLQQLQNQEEQHVEGALKIGNGNVSEQDEENLDDPLCESKELLEEQLLYRAISLWQTKLGNLAEIVLNQDPPVLQEQDVKRFPNSESKLTAAVKPIIPTDTVSKRGYLFCPEDGHRVWMKRWFVIRRPYMFKYASQAETEELGVINLSSSRVDYKRPLENMLERPFVFAVYTPNNAYMLQASSHGEMVEWITKIDQFYPVSSITFDDDSQNLLSSVEN
ncbi:uncharacterized protein VTP21DRAFT_11587 [Calcarisporiella thermophila]|uniref:uncharacterized protein n=1 Tax=Calcarisporiella thermophila TaxID=911321 RepID=UPI0037436EFE